MALGTPDYDLYPWTNPVFIKNQAEFPPEELLNHGGLHIAWSWDGSQILASDPDETAATRAGTDGSRRQIKVWSCCSTGNASTPRIFGFSITPALKRRHA